METKLSTVPKDATLFLRVPTALDERLALAALAEKKKRLDRRVGKSALVREALDDWLTERGY